ncbi:MAG TPA: rhodanese-like domain-containing protein, partial [Methanosarcinales archaeon]|nr:rhodanese-like domain-containing protein [Methanosarcinales archaeon]
MKRIFILIVLSVVLFSFVGCNGKAAVASDIQNNDKISTHGGYFYMKQDEANRNMKEDKSIVLVDVRTQEEYADVHIPGSILIPLDT